MSESWPIETEIQEHCPVCSARGWQLYPSVVDLYFGTPGEWGVLRCPKRGCGTIWLNPRPTFASMPMAYMSYYTHETATERQVSRPRVGGVIARLLGLTGARESLYMLRAAHLAPGRLLDVGCGNGQRMAAFRDLGWEVFGQEVDDRAAQAAAQQGLEVFVGQIEEMPISQPFDLILLNHVIEHVHDPAELLRECRSRLRRGGRVLILTPNAHALGRQLYRERWRGLEAPRHLQVFTGSSLESLIRATSLTPVEVFATPVNAQWFAEQWASLMKLPRGIQKAIGWAAQAFSLGIWLMRRDSGEELYACAALVE